MARLSSGQLDIGIDGHEHAGPVAFQLDTLDLADLDAGDFHGHVLLESGRGVENGVDFVAHILVEIESADAEGHVSQKEDRQNHEKTDFGLCGYGL